MEPELPPISELVITGETYKIVPNVDKLNPALI
jgi:hypothetical protein